MSTTRDLLELIRDKIQSITPKSYSTATFKQVQEEPRGMRRFFVRVVDIRPTVEMDYQTSGNQLLELHIVVDISYNMFKDSIEQMAVTAEDVNDILQALTPKVWAGLGTVYRLQYEGTQIAKVSHGWIVSLNWTALIQEA